MKVPTGRLRHAETIFYSSLAERMSWAADRNTTRREDKAYCLMGIFKVNMPLLYGEGDMAFVRLQEEIIQHANDQSIFCWSWDDGVQASQWSSLLAPVPSVFKYAGRFRPTEFYDAVPQPYHLSNAGLSIATETLPTLNPYLVFAVLDVVVDIPEEQRWSLWSVCLPLEKVERKLTFSRASFRPHPLIIPWYKVARDQIVFIDTRWRPIPSCTITRALRWSHDRLYNSDLLQQPHDVGILLLGGEMDAQRDRGLTVRSTSGNATYDAQQSMLTFNNDPSAAWAEGYAICELHGMSGDWIMLRYHSRLDHEGSCREVTCYGFFTANMPSEDADEYPSVVKHLVDGASKNIWSSQGRGGITVDRMTIQPPVTHSRAHQTRNCFIVHIGRVANRRVRESRGKL